MRAVAVEVEINGSSRRLLIEQGCHFATQHGELSRGIDQLLALFDGLAEVRIAERYRLYEVHGAPEELLQFLLQAEVGICVVSDSPAPRTPRDVESFVETAFRVPHP